VLSTSAAPVLLVGGWTIATSLQPRSFGQARLQDRAIDSVEDPQGRGHRPRSQADRAHLADVPGRGGHDDPRRGLLPRWYGVLAPLVRAVLCRAWHPARAPGRGSPPIPPARGWPSRPATSWWTSRVRWTALSSW